MQIDKQQIMAMLRDSGDEQKAQDADREMPQTVDTEKPEDANLLEKFGIDPGDLVSKFMDGKGIPGF